MTPSQFLEDFHRTTNSKFYDRRSADEAIANGKCKLLVDGRKYTSPIGLTVDDDMQNGAAGVDE
jgi:chaperone required for assembly of F1-ATPase